jgi:hypothetical protein
MTPGADATLHPETLQKRFRSFVARPAEPPAATPEPEGDVPLLTEIVTPAGAAPALLAIDPAALRAALEESLCRWLDTALPQLIEKLEDGTRQKL